METITLDGGAVCSRESAYELLAAALGLPDCWGRNLDALHDCLTEVGQPTRVEVVDCGALEGTVFGQGLLRVLEDTAWENPCFELEEL
jgi:ribonuclease inhibitor